MSDLTGDRRGSEPKTKQYRAHSPISDQKDSEFYLLSRAYLRFRLRLGIWIAWPSTASAASCTASDNVG